jgi:hypothetical protein
MYTKEQMVEWMQPKAISKNSHRLEFENGATFMVSSNVDAAKIWDDVHGS